MMHARAMSISRSVVVSLTCLLLFPTLSVAKSSSSEPVGRLSASGSTAQWMTVGDHAAIDLIVVAPDGSVFRKEFAAGSTPSFRLQDLGGKLTDGSYSYELRAIPRISAEVKRQLAAARAADDDAAAARIQQAAGIGATMVQSGSLSVVNGAFINPDVEEPPSSVLRLQNGTSSGSKGAASLSGPRTIKPLDIVQPDDVIIQGSLCVGLDCVVNESFGFDTIRLKENNTRIKFQDTSAAAGFPTHDWQLTANDSNSGGAEKFSIEDITAATVPFTVTGSSPTNSLFIDSTGRLGLRTGTPVLDLHISTGNTPAIRQEQTSAGGFTAQTWDIGANEANWFVRDVTGGSRLPLRIRPGAPTSSIDISSSGNVGIGTGSPQVLLDVRGTNATADIFEAIGINPTTGPSLNFGYSGATFGRGSGFFNVRPDALAAAPNPSIRFMIANVQKMILDNEGFLGLDVANPAFPIDHSSGAHLTAGGVWTDASSREFKQDICDLDSREAREALNVMTPVKFVYKANPSEHHVGFIAEDVPAHVATSDRKSLSPMDVVAVLTKVVQEQQKTIDLLSARVKDLEAHHN